ncbi:MAG: transglycosylase SLT domain-containing protein [Geminicoccaceae bacterium]
MVSFSHHALGVARRQFACLAIVAGITSIAMTSAYGNAPTVNARTVCAEQAAERERAERVPPGLVLALALAESGRWSEPDKTTRPWPWTVTSGKDSFYLPSKAAAIAKVRELRASGRTNIDVGCMQINLHYHPDAFANLDDALDPDQNVAYGAKFLKRLRVQTRSWGKATAFYHSQDRTRGSAYRDRVYKFWRKLRRKREPQQGMPTTLRPAKADKRPLFLKDRVVRPLFSRRPAPLWKRDAIPVLRGG